MARKAFLYKALMEILERGDGNVASGFDGHLFGNRKH